MDSKFGPVMYLGGDWVLDRAESGGSYRDHAGDAVYELTDIDWNQEGRIEIGWRGDHIFIVKFLLVLGAIGAPLTAGFLAINEPTFGWYAWGVTALPLAIGVTLAGVVSFFLPTVALDRRDGYIRVGNRRLSFDDVSVVSVTEQRHYDGGHPGGVLWFSVEVTDRDGRNWTVESARQRHEVAQIRDLLVDALKDRGIDADW